MRNYVETFYVNVGYYLALTVLERFLCSKLQTPFQSIILENVRFPNPYIFIFFSIGVSLT